MRLLLPALLLAATVSCIMDAGGMEWRDAQVHGRTPPVPVEVQVRSAIRSMHDAYGRGDWDRLAWLVTPRVTCYNAHDGSLVTGRDAVVALFRGMAEQPAPSRMEGIEVRLDGPTALATYRFVEEKDGKASVSIVTHALRLRDGAWLTTHLHWSGVPGR